MDARKDQTTLHEASQNYNEVVGQGDTSLDFVDGQQVGDYNQETMDYSDQYQGSESQPDSQEVVDGGVQFYEHHASYQPDAENLTPSDDQQRYNAYQTESEEFDTWNQQGK